MRDSKIENLDEILDHLIESMDVAMKAEGVDKETREVVTTTVQEAAANNSEVLLPYISDEEV